jgi:hypothetical protein
MVVRRFVTLAFSLCLVLAIGFTWVEPVFAQGDAKKDTPPAKAEVPAKETAKIDPAKTEPAKKEEPTKTEAKAIEPPLPPIPAEVQAKIDAARKAVAEMIVAAQDAGLVETSIDPPPILDILINGRATDKLTLKNTGAKKPYPVSPEVFGAWFTGYGKVDGINYAEDVRIINPSAGLKQWYDTRARILEQYIQEIRKAKGPAPTPKKEEAKPAETKKAPEVAKPAEPTKAAEPKK